MPWPLNDLEKQQLIKLGEKVKAIRTEKNLSLEDVGKRIGKDRQSIHKLEKGDFQSIVYIPFTSVQRFGNRNSRIT